MSGFEKFTGFALLLLGLLGLLFFSVLAVLEGVSVPLVALLWGAVLLGFWLIIWSVAR